MRRLIYGLLLLVAVLVAESVSAQLKTSYFMEGSYFRTELNPALKPTRGYIALPLVSGYSGGLYSNVDVEYSLLNRDIASENFDMSRLLRNVPKNSMTNIQSNANVLGAGFYTNSGMFWNFGLNLRMGVDTSVPKDVYRAAESQANGFYAFENLNLSSTSYLDAYLGTAFSIGRYVTLGVRAKFLVGIQNLSYDISGCTIADGSLEKVVGTMRMWNPEYDSTGEWSDDGRDVWGNMRSFGGAIDLGVEVSLLGDHLKLSAAVTDLGFIRWSKTSGIVAPIDDQEVDLSKPEVWKGYNTRLTCNVNAGVEYNFCKNHLAVGLLSHTRIYQSGIASELTASFNIRPTNWITLTASHTFLNGNKPGVFGAAVNIHPCGINIFAGMDYVATEYVGTGLYPFQLMAIDAELMMPRRAKSMNVYMGIGFNLARPKHVRRAEEICCK